MPLLVGPISAEFESSAKRSNAQTRLQQQTNHENSQSTLHLQLHKRSHVKTN